MPRILNDSIPWFDTAVDAAVCAFVIMFYVAIHMFGWNLLFLTRTEKTSWRVAVLVLSCTTWVTCVWQLLWNMFQQNREQ